MSDALKAFLFTASVTIPAYCVVFATVWVSLGQPNILATWFSSIIIGFAWTVAFLIVSDPPANRGNPWPLAIGLWSSSLAVAALILIAGAPS